LGYGRVLGRALHAWIAGNAAEVARHKSELAFMLLAGRADTVTFRRSGTEWTVFVDDRFVSCDLFVDGGYQTDVVPPLVRWARAHGRLSAAQRFVVDVGANVGMSTIPLARAMQRGVVAIEPQPAVFEVLTRNVSRNGLADQVICVQAAIGTAGSRAMMVGHPRCSVSEVKAPGARQGFGAPGPDNTETEVPMYGLETVLERHALAPHEIVLVWSDTQGYETEVIRSGRALWSSGVPLFVEVWPVGLEAHGGADRFAEAAREAFREMVPREELVRGGEHARPQSVRGLESLMQHLDAGTTDVLLIP